MRLLAATLSLLALLLGTSHPAGATDSLTVDFTEAVADPTAAQCPQRTVHYSIADAGAGSQMLSVASQWKCDATSGSGSIGVCQLDQTLKCRSDVQFRDKSGKAIDLSGYAVSSKGVTAKGELHPWVDPDGAAAVMKSIQATAAQQASKNQAALDTIGGQQNFTELLSATGCRYALVQAGVLQPTAKEVADDARNKKSGFKITVDTSPEHLAACRTTISTFCARRDLPATLTSQEYYKTVCTANP
jgi:hypothetical protein